MEQLSNEEILSLSKTKGCKDEDIIEFAYRCLNNLPFEKGYDNYERMISGMIYRPFDKRLEDARMRARDLAQDFGSLRSKHFDSTESYLKAKHDYLSGCFGSYGKDSYSEHPIHIDYGFNVHIGSSFYSNFNLTLLDCALIKIGDRVLFGPNVSLITATHPSDPTLRGAEVESALPITIGDNVWLSSNVTVLPGVTIGSGSVIGAGSVINKNIPPNSVVVGIPGKVVKVLKEEEHGLDVTSLLEKRGLI